MVEWINGTLGAVETSAAIILSIIFATLGWLYTARRQRSSMRKQHTFNALLTASANKDYQHSLDAIRNYINSGSLPDLHAAENESIRVAVVYLLNHYEFLAAGIRNGDISERLLRDSERGTVVRLFEAAERCGFVQSVRDNRKRRSIFEHIEWLYERWEHKPISFMQRCIKVLHGRPLYHNYYCLIIIAAACFAALSVVALLWLVL